MRLEILDAWRHAWSARDRRPIPEWAIENVTLFPPLTRTGKCDLSTNRHFLLPLEWLQSDAVSEVNVLAPVRSGKTLIGDVFLDWTVVNDPGPFRVVMQDDQMAREHAESRTMPQLKAIPGVQFLLPVDRHKERGQEIIFPNGHHLYVQGPALNKLQSKGFRYMWVDEPWLPTVSKHFGEIKGRLGDYEKMKISKLLCTGQGGENGGPWEAQCSSGEWNEWQIQCAKCGHYMPGRFGAERPDGSRWGIVWDEHRDERGYWNISKCLESVRFECEKCGHAHLDTQRTKDEWNRTGKYERIGPEVRSKKTAHWTFVIDYPWQQAVDQWLQARNVWRATRDIVPTVTFWQKRCAEFKDERSSQGVDTRIKREKYDGTKALPGEVARIMTIDRQQEDLFYYLIRAWLVKGPHVETRRIAFGKAYSFAELDKIATETCLTHRPLIDSGHAAKGPNGVYAACVRYKWIAMKGVGAVTSFMHIIKDKRGGQRKVMRSYAPRSYGDSETAAGSCLLFRFSTSAACDVLQGLIDAGNWIEPEVDPATDETEKSYSKQMRSEAQVPVRNARTGKIEMQWKTIDDDNHAWDMSKMQVEGAIIGKVLPDPFSVVTEQTQTNEMSEEKEKQTA